MKKKFFYFMFLIYGVKIFGQRNTEGDLYFQINKYSYGVALGMSYYIGDINPNFEDPNPGILLSVFLKKNLNSYIALKYQFAYLHFGYADANAQNEYRQKRNLSFETNIYEASIQADINFFKYNAGIFKQNFTPYLNFGFGLFYFDSYTNYKGNKYRLRNIQTENINYLPISLAIPLGIGFKWGLNRYVNMGIEFSTRLTLTDYIDDVSSNYIGTKNDGSIKDALQDRSVEKGILPVGIIGRQRGQSTANDIYYSVSLYFSFNFYKYYCP